MKFQQKRNSLSNIQLNTVIDELKKLIDKLVIENRKRHILGVADFSIRLAKKLGLNLEMRQKLLVAAYAHDLFRDVGSDKLLMMSRAYKVPISSMELKRPVLLHSKVAAKFLELRFGIDDKEILEAVEYHTSGRKNMGLVAKIIFVSDSLEESRRYSGVEKIRRLIFENFDNGFFEVLRNKLDYVIMNNLVLLQDSVELWNETILKEGVKQA